MMAGQAIVRIGDREWAVDVAAMPWELSQGLGGLSTLPAGTGMLFDLGWEQTIEVTTVPMLFPLDIAFLSEEMVVTEVYRNVEPGYIVTSQAPARYFLEVNSGELADVEAGRQTEISLVVAETASATPDWTSTVFGFAGVMVMGMFTISLVRDLTKKAVEEPRKKPLLYGPQGENLLADIATGTCYADAWRFMIKHSEGKLVHGTVYSGNRRIGHAWVQANPDFIWEPQTGRYFTNLGFRHDYAPIVNNAYTSEQAAIMVARTGHFGPWTGEERRRFLGDKSPAVIPEYPRQPKRNDELELLPDSPEFLAYTIDDIGFREILDSAFKEAIARARGVKRWQ
ncbi:MAG: DUF192 domain-containing protein [Candidatus Omnitrophica bacterium]|nr:DUF192 domain-containing protein [Candidatus Omnitrophota bacterium]